MVVVVAAAAAVVVVVVVMVLLLLLVVVAVEVVVLVLVVVGSTLDTAPHERHRDHGPMGEGSLASSQRRTCVKMAYGNSRNSSFESPCMVFLSLRLARQEETKKKVRTQEFWGLGLWGAEVAEKERASKDPASGLD